MFQRISLTILSLFILNLSKGNARFIRYEVGRGVFVVGDGYSYGDQFRKEALLVALDEMRSAYFNDSVFVTVRLGLDSFGIEPAVLQRRRKYYVGYDFHKIITTDKERSKWTPLKGYVYSVNLYITEPDFSIRDCLKLVYYAWKHREEIEGNQTSVFIRTSAGDYEGNSEPDYTSGRVINYFEKINTITRAKTNEILSRTYEPVEDYVRQKIYTRILRGSKGLIHSYIQNDSFHFYRTKGNEHEFSWNRKERNIRYEASNKQEHILLISKYGGPIRHDDTNHHFIFLDTAVWYYSDKAGKLTGPILFRPHPYLVAFEEETFVNYTVYKPNDSEIVIPKKTIFDGYSLVYHIPHQTLNIDTSSFGPYLKGGLAYKEKEAAEQNSKLSKPTIPIKHTYLAMLITGMVMLGISIYIFRRKPIDRQP